MSEITSELFEALRRRIWMEKFILNNPWPTTKEFDAWSSGYTQTYDGHTVGYDCNAMVMHNHFLWQAMVPTLSYALANEAWSSAFVPLEEEPTLESHYWCRIARTWVYTDFDPNNGCCICGWEDQTETLAGWFYHPAHWELPAPLSKFTQQQKTVETTIYDSEAVYTHGQLIRYTANGPVYWYDSTIQDFRACTYEALAGAVTNFAEDSVWPANRIYREHQKLPVELQRFYKFGRPRGVPMDERYEIISGTSYRREEARLIISGNIGARFVEYHSVSGSTVTGTNYYPYFAVSGNPWKAKKWDRVRGTWNYPDMTDAYEDEKQEGYQSFVEQVMEKGNFTVSTEDETPSLWEPNWVPIFGGGYELEAIPKLALMSDLHFRCNGSAFEYALKKIGHFDWYLDLDFAPDPAQNFRRDYPYRAGCWRRCWEYSHIEPGTVMWPSELGDPPYAFQEFEWNEETHTYPDEFWWYCDPADDTEWLAHIGLVEAAYATALSEHASTFEAMYKRHQPTIVLWNKIAAEVTEVPGADIVDYGSDRGFWLGAFELKSEILAHMQEVLDIERWYEIGTLAFEESTRTKDASGDQSTWTAARDAGAWSAWGAWGTFAIGLQVENTQVTTGFGSFNRPGLTEHRIRMIFNSELTQEQLDLIDISDKFAVLITIAGGGTGGEPLEDTGAAVYNYPAIIDSSGERATISGLVDINAVQYQFDYFETRTVQIDVDIDTLTDTGIIMQFDEPLVNWVKPAVLDTTNSYYFTSFTPSLVDAKLWGKLKPVVIGELLEDYIYDET